MIKKITTRLSGTLLCLALGVSAFAGPGNTPMQTFINREKESNQFVTVSNIWQADNTFDKTQLLTKVQDAQPLVIDYSAVADLVKKKTQDIQLVVPKLGGGTYTVTLGRYDFLATDFKMVIGGPNGSESTGSYTPGVYYRGIVDGVAGSVAAFSFFNNEVYGIFSIPNEGNYVLVPNTMVGTYYGSNTHYLLYNDSKLLITDKAPGCDADKLPDIDRPLAESRTTTDTGTKLYDNCRDVEVYYLADYSTYHSKGSSSNNVMNYTTALFNNQSTIYRNEGILIDLKAVKIDTTDDVYDTVSQTNVNANGPTAFLTLFGQQTQNNLNGANLAMLLSTKYGTLGGVAWLQTMCLSYQANQSAGPYAYCNIDNSAVVNFPTFSWDVTVVTHEMGHIVGSPHTHRCCWNPPLRATAIDGCYTLEGSCSTPSPQYPATGGTIMSYCHLVSGVGINYANGFGQQPGDTVRYYLSHNTCGTVVNIPTALTTANRTISANRECLDPVTGITYYWNDHNTASETDDTLALMINKGTTNIGTLDSTGFSVSSSTDVSFGSGAGLQLTFPSGTANVPSGYTPFAMRHYWKISASTQPTAPVEVIFPFTTTDLHDMGGSINNSSLASNSIFMYKVPSPLNPDPALGLNGATSSNVSTLSYAATASSTSWSLTTNTAGVQFAHMKLSDLTGGGSAYALKAPTAVNTIASANGNINIFPNPTTDNWNIVVPSGYTGKIMLQLTTVDGKTVRMQELNGAGTYTVDANSLATGVYFYHLVGTQLNASGSLVKNK